MDIQPQTTVAAPVDAKAWLKSKHGIDSTISGTAAVADFADVIDSDGYIPSGTPVVLSGTTYVPTVTDDGEGGFDQVEADGHIFESVKADGGATNVGIAVLWHGLVVTAQVPVPDGATYAPASGGSPHVKYV